MCKNGDPQQQHKSDDVIYAQADTFFTRKIIAKGQVKLVLNKGFGTNRVMVPNKQYMANVS